MQEYRELTVTAVRRETDDCVSIDLKPDGEPLLYRPGQFLTLVFPSVHGEERRNYSISSAALPGEALTITVKRIPNGTYSRRLFDRASPGDSVLTAGVGGFFVLPEDKTMAGSVYFIAAGSGITPVFSLLKSVLYRYPLARVVLIYSNSSLRQAIFYAALRALEQQFADRFRVTYLFSDAKSLERARLSKWLLPRLLRELDAPAGALYYICGPFDYMRMVNVTLLEASVATQQIKKENFLSFRPDNTQLPPDLEGHSVHITFAGRAYTLQVRYPISILDAALLQQIPLPFSCRSGNCGACAARCTSGTVWMRYNAVLMEREIRNGIILTCVGYPVFGPVRLAW